MVFLFGSFTEDEASAFQSSPLESPHGKKIQSPVKSVKENGFYASKSASSVAKQNGHFTPSKGVNKSNGRVNSNGKAAENAVDALGEVLGQIPKKQFARPGIAVAVGGLQTAVKPSVGGVNNHLNFIASKSPEALASVQGGAQTSVKGSDAAVNKSVNLISSPPPKAFVPDEDAEVQSPRTASGGANDDSVDDPAAPPTNNIILSENGDQIDWFVINTLDVSGAKDARATAEESPAKLVNNNEVKGGLAEQVLQVATTADTEIIGGLEKNGSGASLDDKPESVPSKLLPKSWAALVGVPGESKAAPKQSAGVKGKGRGPTGHLGPNKTQLVEKVVVPVTALSGETWLKSLREAEVSSRRLQPRGLINTGNSCFLNSTMQAMLSCSAFTHLLEVLKARSIPQTGYPTLQAFVDFSGEFESLAARILSKSWRDGDGRTPSVTDVGRPFAPAMFDTVLQSFTPDQAPRRIGHNRQEDAQEFLSFVIDRMHEEILRLQGKDSPSVQSASLITSSEDDDWEMVGPKNRSSVTRMHTFSESAITDIFGGQLRSVVKTKGNKASATVQPFLVLHLDIVPEVVHSVEDALRFFAAPESLEGYKPSTSKVGEVVSASKSVKIQTLPRVLILHLMRFSYGSGGSSKLHKPVQFPLELMLGRELLASTTASGNEVRKYELAATLSHHGKDPSVGHYTADSKQASGQWLHFDDGVVSGVNVTHVLQEQAYVLFYKRAGF